MKGKARYEYYTSVLRRNPIYSHYHPVPFQYEDWIWMDKTNEGCLVRACGGSKTFDAVNWAILRATLYPNEHGAWLAAASGQLDQARFYFEDSPFVKEVKGSVGKEVIRLASGGRILLRGATASITGLRLDWIILDEEEMLQPRQVQLVYPQLHGRLTFSSVGKFFHLGTMQYDARLFMENIEMYPNKIHDWTQCPWLVKAGHIQRLIDEGHTPEFTIDMLYRCIPTAPNGMLFTMVEEWDDSNGIDFRPLDVKYGIDFGTYDECVGIVIKGKICYVVEEYTTFQCEGNIHCFDFIKGRLCEVESNGYNDSDRYGKKASTMVRQIGATRAACSNSWKQERQFMARQFDKIIIKRKECPESWKDIKGAMFGEDGLYFKHTTKAPCHCLDAFLHAIKPSRVKVRSKHINTSHEMMQRGSFGTI